MIEINLLPGGTKRRKRSAGGAFGLKVPESFKQFDRLMLFVVGAWVIGPALLVWMYMSVQGRISDTQVALDRAVADSTRFAQIIQTQTHIRARQDTIAQKLAIIQEIDAGRFIWPHILDEVSLALPPYTWLQSVDQVSGGPTPTFQIEGRTGSLPALTRYMDALEASPFIRGVQLVSSEQAQLGNDATKVVNNFILTATFESPPLEALETVPLFEGAEALLQDSVPAAAEVSNGAPS